MKDNTGFTFLELLQQTCFLSKHHKSLLDLYYSHGFKLSSSTVQLPLMYPVKMTFRTNAFCILIYDHNYFLLAKKGCMNGLSRQRNQGPHLNSCPCAVAVNKWSYSMSLSNSKRIGVSTVVTGMYAQNLLPNLEQERALGIFFCRQEI